MKKLLRVFAVLLLLVGVGLLAYPHFSQWQYDRKVQTIITNFEQDVGGSAQANPRLEELYLRLLAENKLLFDEGQKNLTDPFSYEQPGIDLREYGIEENILGYLIIPQLEETLPIYLGANEQNMKQGAVHLTQTSYPVGGENSNSVLAAHRGFYKAAMFRNIQKMGMGDTVEVHNFREKLLYTVVGTEIIQPEEIDRVLIQPGKDMLTLITCHPYGQNSHRYVVYCERDTAAEAEQITEA